MPYKILKTVRSQGERGKNVLALLFFTVLVGAFFYKTLFFGKLPVPTDALVGLYHPYRDSYAANYPNGIPFKNFLITDPVRQQIPWRKTVIDDIKKGQLPLWNASSFGGMPLLANIQAGALYPLNILFLIFSFETAWSLLIISQPLLGGIFLYLFLRNKHLGVLSSLVGAIIFAFSGFSTAWLTWGTMFSTWLWTPLGLLAIDKIHSDHKWYWGLLLGFSLVSSFFAGHLQLFLYSAVVLATYVLWGTHAKKSRNWLVYAVILAGVALVTAPQWIAILKWLPQTSRVTEGAMWQKEGFFIPIQHLIQFIAPDYFGNPATLNYWGTWNYGEMVGYAGIAGLSLAALGISLETLFWFIVVIAALLFAVASPVSLLPYQLHIPFVTLLQPTRLMAVIDLGVSVLAAYGFSELINGKQGKRLISVFVSLLIVLIVLWGSVLLLHVFGIPPENVLVAKRNIIVPTILVIGLFLLLIPLIGAKQSQIRKLYISVFGVALTVFLVFDLFRFGWKFTPFTDRAYFFPETKITTYLEKQTKPFRVMATDDRIFPPNVNEYYGIESIAGYDPIHPGRYEEYIAAMERGSADIRPPYGFERIIAPKSLKSPLLKLLNIRYVLSFDEIPSNIAKKVLEEGKTKVYEMTNLTPRVYLAQNIQYKASKQEVINALYDKSFTPGSTAIVESTIHLLSTPLTSDESATIRTYESNSLTMDVTVNNQRLLVIGNMYDVGWRASIDNESAALYRVNYLFLGVVVPPGHHVVILIYR